MNLNLATTARHSVVIGMALASVAIARADDRCIQGYVWREAFRGDHVCVSPMRRQQVAEENSQILAHRDPSGRPDICAQGFVWREAAQGDHVCVSFDSRAAAAQENRVGPELAVRSPVGPAPSPAPAPPPGPPGPGPLYSGVPGSESRAAFRPITSGDATLKGVEFMAYQLNFIHAEVNGNDATGYDEYSFVSVHTAPYRNGAYIYVTAFSQKANEAKRICDLIASHVFDGQLKFRTPQVYWAPDRARKPTAILVRWNGFTKPGYHLCTEAVLRQNGLTNISGGGGSASGASSATQIIIMSFSIPENESTQVLVIAGSTDSGDADRLMNRIPAGIRGCATL